MRKTIIYIAMSIDGYIADKNNGVSWLGGDNSDPESMGSFFSFFETIDTVILGWKTYSQIINELSPEEWPYKGKKTYVLTHRSVEDTQDISFISIENLTDFIEDLKKESGSNIWICGGANIIHQVLEQKAFDRLHISVMPVVLGDGVPLFSRISDSIPLKLIHTEVSNGITDLVYEII